MLKHVGKHNNQKIVILFRKVPDEDHMCLVSYSDLLPRIYHDEIMKVLESAVGQNAKEFSDVLFRTILSDGKNCLEALHSAGLIKKVPTSQVLVTPTNSSSVRLDELNGILDEMSKGEAAVKRLADLDADAGMSGKQRRAEPREVGAPNNSRATAAVEGTMSAEQYVAVTDGVLDDATLATQRLAQATKMKAEAQSLLAEAARLEQEASSLKPASDVRTKTKKASTAAKKQTA
jgi:hypothetical protein